MTKHGDIIDEEDGTFTFAYAEGMNFEGFKSEAEAMRFVEIRDIVKNVRKAPDDVINGHLDYMKQKGLKENEVFWQLLGKLAVPRTTI